MKTYYVAWLNGVSVARGRLHDVKEKAIMIANTENFREFGGQQPATLHITQGPRQLFVASYVLPPLPETT